MTPAESNVLCLLEDASIRLAPVCTLLERLVEATGASDEAMAMLESCARLKAQVDALSEPMWHQLAAEEGEDA